jgi:hypothetical protein
MRHCAGKSVNKFYRLDAMGMMSDVLGTSSNYRIRSNGWATVCGLPPGKKPKPTSPDYPRAGTLGSLNHPIRPITAGRMGGWFVTICPHDMSARPVLGILKSLRSKLVHAPTGPTLSFKSPDHLFRYSKVRSGLFDSFPDAALATRLFARCGKG